MSNYFSLDEVCRKNYFILIDTCSFETSFRDSSKESSFPEEKLENVVISNNNISFWIEKIPLYGKLYSTNGVINEIRNCRYNYKKSIKIPIFKKRDKKTVVQLRRELSQNRKNKFNLANIIEFEGRIFKMNENQEKTYDLFSEKYSFFEEKFNLSKVDLDLVFLGGVISREKNTSIISNDFGIRQAWRSFLKREPFSGRDFSFYSGCMINLFKQERLNLQSKLSGSIIKI